MSQKRNEKRVDQVLVELKLVRSRSQAAELIKQKLVSFRGKPVSKVSYKIPEDRQVEDFQIQDSDFQRFVSRGGVKMQGALDELSFSPEGLWALDIGISTGGFSDCLLQNGAAGVVGIDVGHDQLGEKLKGREGLVHLEGINARDFSQSELQKYLPEGRQGVDLVVVDVSFISIKTILPMIFENLDSEGHLLALVKPQFEVGRSGLGKGGRVSDKTLYEGVQNQVCQQLKELGFLIKNYMASPIKGSDGNQEFFVFAKKSS